MAHSHGLSPRVRGSRSPVDACNRVDGSIPASTGQPQAADVITGPSRCRGLSPRVRGSRSNALFGRITPRSIPRVRGSLLKRASAIIKARSIPASTGAALSSPACSPVDLLKRSIPASTGQPDQRELASPRACSGSIPASTGQPLGHA